jgi:pimeloyl-ACP methyl ester carboxylesterase
VGLAFAAAAPQQIRSLLTIGPPVHALTMAERLTKIYPLVAIYRVAGPIGMIMSALTNTLIGLEAIAAQPDSAKAILDAFRNADRSEMFAAMRSAMLNRPDITDRLDRISTPTVMAVGRGDAMWDPEHARAATSLMPCATTIEVRGSGHVGPLLLDVDLLTRTITELWAGASRR